MNAPELSISESGIRRLFRGNPWLRNLLQYVLPMTRKRTEDKESSFDRSVIIWRAFLTAVVLYFGSREPAQSPNMQSTLDRIDHRMEMLDQRLTEDFSPRITKLEQRLNSFINGVNRNQTGTK